MEDILIILLGLAWIIYSLYKKSKKSQQQQGSQQPARKSSDSDIASILEQFMGEEEKTEEHITTYKTIDEPERTIPSKEYISSWQQQQPSVETLESLEKIEHKDIRNDIADVLKQDEFEEIEDETTQYIDKTEIELFDLKKAVIYFAILHRPYAV